MKTRWILTIAVLTLGLFTDVAPSFAQGDRPGGGGDILRCRESAYRKRQYYLLDVYEQMKSSEPQLLNLGNAEMNIHEKIDLVRDSFKALDPVRADLYAKEAHQIAEDLAANARKRPSPHRLAVALDQRLKDIDDANDIFLFENCEKFQLVRQKDPRIGKGAVYQFDSKLWQMLDLDNQVATLYHEVVYREFRNYGAEVSLPTRWFNGRLFSRTAHLMSTQEYLEFLAKNGARRYIYKSNIGELLIKNMRPGEYMWTANFNSAGEIESIPTSELSPGWQSAIGLKFEIPEIASLEFNTKRELHSLKGKFSFAFNLVGERIASTKLDCDQTLLLCIQSDTLHVSEDRQQFEIRDEDTSIIFNTEGKILKVTQTKN